MKMATVQAATILLGCCFIVLGCQDSVAGGREVIESGAGVPSAQQILSNVANVYAQARSYRDTGHVVSRAIRGGDSKVESVTRLEFRTAFVRPYRFRFEYVPTNGRRYIIWRERGDVRTWWSAQGGEEQRESLGSAVAGATGVSRGSAHTVPSLLLPDVGGYSITHLADVSAPLVKREGQRDFYVIAGKPRGWVPGPTEYSVWIDTQTYALRRVTRRTEAQGRIIITKIEYDGTIDATVTPEELEFMK